MDRINILGRHFTLLKGETIKVTLTGGAGNIGYVLAFFIAQGRMFGPTQRVELTLLDLPFMEKALKGVEMELKDSAYPLLANIRSTVDQNEGFRGCQIALLVGAKPRSKGMERKDLLQQNAMIFKNQAKVLDQEAHEDCKVVVVGNPANTNAYIISQFSKKIKKENITALTRLDENRSLNQISEKSGINVKDIKNLVIWGNHSLTQFPDIKNTQLLVNNNFESVDKFIDYNGKDQEWYRKIFIPTVQKRGGQIIQMRKLSSAASAASSVCDHIHDWLVGTKPGCYSSFGIISDGSYNIPKGICFSFPCYSENGVLKVVQNLSLSDDFSKKMIAATVKELQTEAEVAMKHLSQN